MKLSHKVSRGTFERILSGEVTELHFPVDYRNTRRLVNRRTGKFWPIQSVIISYQNSSPDRLILAKCVSVEKRDVKYDDILHSARYVVTVTTPKLILPPYPIHVFKECTRNFIK